MLITQSLRGEHGAINALLNFIELRATDASSEQLGLLADALSAVLLSHAAIEDDFLRPAILPFLPPPPGGPDAPTDHQILANLLRKAGKADDADARRDLLCETLEQTRKHFTKEETEVFPLTEREVSIEEQRSLGTAWAARRQVALR
jgi:hemerythrin